MMQSKFVYNLFIGITLFFSSLEVKAQFHNPVKWEFSFEKVEGNTFQLLSTAHIDAGWHLYSQFINDGGPIPTSFSFFKDDNLEFIGNVKELGNVEEQFDPMFEMDVKWFSEFAQFAQLVTVKNFPAKIKGELEFMVCDDSRCLPPEIVEFKYDIPNQGAGNDEAHLITDKENIDNAIEEIIENYIIEEEQSGESIDLPFGNNDGGMLQPAKWFVEIVENQRGSKDLRLSVVIENGWHLYARDIPEGGPIPTSILFHNEDEKVEWLGDLQVEGEKITKFDPVFEMDLSWYEQEVAFVQSFKHDLNQTFVSGEVEFMLCDDERCLAPELISFRVRVDQQGIQSIDLLSNEDAVTNNITTADTGQVFDWKYGDTDCAGNKSNTEKKGNWMILLLGFGGGLLALLTPCVFPMIPLTVSFFTKGGKDRKRGLINAIVYGISIVVIYVLLGLLITGTLGADALNALSTSAFFNLLFFVVFIVFAISFLGFFEITLPASWVNKSDQAADKGGLIGIFFMAFTLSLVSFSCTGPIIGTLLVETATGGGSAIFGRIPVRPLLGMLGFSLALAIPFTLFAAFPNWLNNLPKSGGWLDYVKKLLGFIEAALAFKFLSIADMAYGWGILKYELFLAIWIVIFFGLTLYSFGVLKFPKDEPIQKLGLGRIGVGVISLFFSGYMVMGLVNYEPLSALSGLAPPTHYNYFNNDNYSENIDGLTTEGCPADLFCFKDYSEAQQYALKVNKPLLIDFTGYGCVNCRKMEENVWTVDDVNKIMQKYVLVSLYVDDKKALPENEQYVSNSTGKEKKIKSIGNKWSDFQATHFKTNSQPYYVLVDPKDNTILNKPEGYLPDKSNFKEFLNCGLNNFKKEKEVALENI